MVLLFLIIASASAGPGVLDPSGGPAWLSSPRQLESELPALLLLQPQQHLEQQPAVWRRAVAAETARRAEHALQPHQVHWRCWRGAEGADARERRLRGGRGGPPAPQRAAACRALLGRVYSEWGYDEQAREWYGAASGEAPDSEDVELIRQFAPGDWWRSVGPP